MESNKKLWITASYSNDGESAKANFGVVSDTYVSIVGFSQLSDNAKRFAYGEYCKAMDNDENREFTMTYNEFCNESDWEGYDYLESGECLG